MHILIQNGSVAEYPYSLAKLRRNNPQVSFPKEPSPELLAEYGVFTVVDTAEPAHDPLAEQIVQSTPEFSEGAWRKVWNVMPLAPEEAAERQKSAAVEADRQAVKLHSFVQQFIEMTPQQVLDRIEADVTNLATAKTMLKRFGVMLNILARREFR